MPIVPGLKQEAQVTTSGTNEDHPPGWLSDASRVPDVKCQRKNCVLGSMGRLSWPPHLLHRPWAGGLSPGTPPSGLSVGSRLSPAPLRLSRGISCVELKTGGDPLSLLEELESGSGVNNTTE